MKCKHCGKQIIYFLRHVEGPKWVHGRSQRDWDFSKCDTRSNYAEPFYFKEYLEQIERI